MKTMIAIFTFAFCATAAAMAAVPTRTPLIQCVQTEPFEAAENYNIRIEARSGKAANWIQVFVLKSSDLSLVNLEIDKLIEDERGSIEGGEVTHLLGRDGRLTIEYPYGYSKLSHLSAVFVGKKNGVAYAVPMKCTHL